MRPPPREATTLTQRDTAPRLASTLGNRLGEDVVHGVEVGAQVGEVTRRRSALDDDLRQVVVDMGIDAQQQMLDDHQAVVAGDIERRPPTTGHVRSARSAVGRTSRANA